MRCVRMGGEGLGEVGVQGASEGTGTKSRGLRVAWQPGL